MRTPDRASLSDQVADILRQEIRQSAWEAWLPSTRELCKLLKVNRQTVLLAIGTLAEEGLVTQIPRRGVKIVRKTKSEKSSRSRRIGLLTGGPGTVKALGAGEVFRELESTLLHNRIDLSIHRGEGYFRRNSHTRLEQLIKRNPVDCWILGTSDPKVQEWFSRRRIPHVIWGLCREGGTTSPSISIDLAATTRHAVGTLLGLGHRNIALFCEHSLITHMTRDAFVESMRASGHADAVFSVYEHRNEIKDIERMVKRCLESKEPPTALFITRTYSYVAIYGMLTQRGFKVPEDISLICRDADPLFGFMYPNPSHYAFSVVDFAKNLYLLSSKVAKGGIPISRHLVVLPEFVRGNSIAPPP